MTPNCALKSAMPQVVVDTAIDPFHLPHDAVR